MILPQYSDRLKPGLDDLADADQTMIRGLLALLAALLVVGVLTLLIVESRKVNEDYYVAHAERMRAINSSNDDLTAIDQGATSALQDGRIIPSSVELAVARLSENAEILRTSIESSRQAVAIQVPLASYSESLTRFIGNENVFATNQNALADALRSLQDESPAVVNDLRRFNLRFQSQSVFSLAITLIEYATGQSETDSGQLAKRIAALQGDPIILAQVPGILDNFAATANSVLLEHAGAKAALAALGVNTARDALFALSDTVQSENRRTVSRAERARLLLAVCAVLLLGGTGYALLRLQSSYQALNVSNAALESSNESLEERVSSRTEQLSLAYDELSESQVQLVQAEKMSSLGELVAGISHEINTPLYYVTNNSTVVQERLNSISEFCEIATTMITAVKSRQSVKESITRGLTEMQKMMKDGMLEDVDEAKDLMQDNIDGLADLTELAQSLKDFSRLDRARKGQLDVNDGLDKTLLIAKNKLKYSITVTKQYDDVALINCAPSQINQVFLNLITNAADAISGDGEIVIRTWNVGDSVAVSIADTGSGISEDTLSRVRDPFFTTKDVGQGTGLGLSIVDRIITAHEGEFKIESEVGTGTTMTVVLPIGEENQDFEDHDSDPVADMSYARG